MKSPGKTSIRLAALCATVSTTLAIPVRAEAAPRLPQIASVSAVASDSTVDAERRRRVIDSLIVQMERMYVFPEKVPALATMLRQRLQRGDYEAITNAAAFGDSLNAHARQVIADRHLNIRYFPPRRAAVSGSPTRRAEGTPRPVRPNGEGRAWIDSVRVLPNNIGYLALSGFADSADAREPFAAAMTALAGTAALVIDLRGNRGGHPEGVALLISYLVGNDSVQTNSFYFRDGDSTMHFWTTPNVDGKKFGPDKPVYVLTDRITFSAAEEFAYDVQAMKRATLIGEVTGGGANPGQVARLDSEFAAFIPFAAARNPITKTNWEGVGVKPDIPIPAAQALDRALLEAEKRIGTRRAR